MSALNVVDLLHRGKHLEGIREHILLVLDKFQEMVEIWILILIYLLQLMIILAIDEVILQVTSLFYFLLFVEVSVVN